MQWHVSLLLVNYLSCDIISHQVFGPVIIDNRCYCPSLLRTPYLKVQINLKRLTQERRRPNRSEALKTQSCFESRQIGKEFPGFYEEPKTACESLHEKAGLL